MWLGEKKKREKKKVRFGLDILSFGGTVSYWPLVEKNKIAISSSAVSKIYFLPMCQPAIQFILVLEGNGQSFHIFFSGNSFKLFKMNEKGSIL